MAIMNRREIEDKISSLDGWQFNGKEIIKRFEFDSFSEALDFVNEVGDLVEDDDNPPKFMIDIDSVRLRLKPVTTEDVELAENIDAI